MDIITAIDHIYTFEDGDTLTPGMGVSWVGGETGLGLWQYWNPSTKKVIATDFSEHPVLLFPQPYSTRKGNMVVPEATGQQWYYGNITEEGGILQDGKVKTKWASIFEVTTIEVNGMTFPTLKIKGNLATESDHTDKYIYYKSSYQSRSFVCSKLIPIQEGVGDNYVPIITVLGENKVSGDNVLSNDNDFSILTASLQHNGIAVTGDVDFKWQHNDAGVWKDLTSVEAFQTINNNVLTVYDRGVNGAEWFRCVITYQSKEYYVAQDVLDTHDPFYIELGRNIPTQSVKEGETVTYNPKVYDRSTGEISTGWTFIFSFTDNNGQEIADLTEKNLTYDNINKYGGIATKIEARRSA